MKKQPRVDHPHQMQRAEQKMAIENTTPTMRRFLPAVPTRPPSPIIPPTRPPSPIPPPRRPPEYRPCAPPQSPPAEATTIDGTTTPSVAQPVPPLETTRTTAPATAMPQLPQSIPPTHPFPLQDWVGKCGGVARKTAARVWLCATTCAARAATRARARVCQCGRHRRVFVTFDNPAAAAQSAAIPNVDAFEIGPDRYVCRRVPWFELSTECVQGRSPWHMMQGLITRIPELAAARFTLKWKRV